MYIPQRVGLLILICVLLSSLNTGIIKYTDKTLSTLSNGNAATGFLVSGNSKLISVVPLWNGIRVTGISLSDAQYYIKTDVENTTGYFRIFYI